MAKFARSHYQEVARVLANVGASIDGLSHVGAEHKKPALRGWHVATVGSFALMFKLDSSKFDPVKFMRACNLSDKDMETCLENLKTNRDWTIDWRKGPL